MKILIVEDNEDARMILKKILEFIGYDVEEASNGEMALGLATRFPPDMIIADVLMPVMDGFQLCRLVKGDEQLKHIPFVFYTATYTDTEDEQLALKLGADRFIRKPMAPEDFIEIIREVIRTAGSDKRIPGTLDGGDEREILERYSERLVKKLEKKMIDLEREAAQRKEAEKNMKLLASLVEQTDAGLAMADLDGRLIFMNRAFAEMHGYGVEELNGKPVSLLHAREQLSLLDLATDRIKAEGNFNGEFLRVRKDGSVFPALVHHSLYRNEKGAPAGMIRTLRDITAIRDAEKDLIKAKQLLEMAIADAPIGMVMVRPDGYFSRVNQAFCQLIGYEETELLEKTFNDITPAQDYHLGEKVVSDLVAGVSDKVSFEKRYVHKSGRMIDVYVTSTLLRDAEGTPLFFFSQIQDITESKRAEAALQALNRQLAGANQQLQLAQKELLIRNRIAEVFLSVSDEEMYAEVMKIVLEVMESRLGAFGYIDSRGALVVPSMTKNLWEQCHVAGKKTVFPRETWGESSWPRAIREKKTVYANDPSVNLPQGHLSIRRHVSSPLIYHDKVVGLFQVANKETDYTPADVDFLESIGRMVASILDARLRRDEFDRDRERLLFAIEQAGDMIVITHTDGTVQYVNPAFERTTGYSRREAVGQNLRILKSGKQDKAFYRHLWGTISSGRPWQGRMVNKRKDGTLFTEEATISPVRDASGQIVSYVAVKHDITEHLQLTAQFQQAQKMESVGRLAGGVAHDYNNMLSVILGFSGLAIEKLDPADPLYNDLQEIIKASQRATEITRQLLAFARKQVVEPVVLDLNTTIEGMLKMLRRLIGEDIALSWNPKADLWPVKIDPSQLDQILANLFVNARDAITDIGKIIIETHTVTFDEVYCADHPGFVEGDFVMLAVSDNGCGIDSANIEKIFEPFFTTKELGHGTGLGLATVYGIVKQNNGYINVYSEPGKGTTFKIYLPRHKGTSAGVTRENAPLLPEGKGERVLVVEDDEAILKLTGRILQRLGYTVSTANTADEALSVAKRHAGRIHLLLTDVVMPKMNGRELANQLQSFCPNLKTLFMSGYTADIIASRGVLDEGAHFVQKPFSSLVLATAVRKVLDAEREKNSAAGVVPSRAD
jgi:PAS domain S-box-containing protein